MHKTSIYRKSTRWRCNIMEKSYLPLAQQPGNAVAVVFPPCPEPNYGADFERTVSTNIYMPAVWFEHPIFLLRPETTKHQSYCVSRQEVVLECVAQKLTVLAANIWVIAVTLPAVPALTQTHTNTNRFSFIVKFWNSTLNLLICFALVH